MKRSEKEAQGLRAFTGIREVGDEVERIDEIHGMTDFNIGSLKRIPGKLLNSTATTSTIWGIYQLRFRDRNTLVEHVDVNFNAQNDLGTLPGMVFDLPKGPTVQGNDYPVNDTSAQNIYDWTFTNPQPVPPGPYRREYVGVTTLDLSESSLDFDCPNWDTVQTALLTKGWDTSASFGGFCYVKTSWSPAVTWLHVSDRGETNSFIKSLLQGSINILGFWQDKDLHPRHIGFSVDKADVPVGTTSVTVTLTAVTGGGIVLEDAWGPITTTITINVTKMSFTVTVPAVVQRGVAFDVVMACSDPAYEPIGNVSIALTSSDPSDTISPFFTNNTGWSGGSKTVSCTITGGSGDDTFTIDVEDANCLVEGSDSGIINYPATSPIQVTFAGHIKALNYGTPVYFYGGTYQCDWDAGNNRYLYSVFPNSIEVKDVGGVWHCWIRCSWGSYYSAGTEWIRSTKFGSYSYYQSWSIDPGEEDAVTSVSVGV